MLLFRQTILPVYFFIDKYRYECSFHWQIQVSRYCLSKDLRIGTTIVQIALENWQAIQSGSGRKILRETQKKCKADSFQCFSSEMIQVLAI